MLAIITPTRGRPQQFAELVKAVASRREVETVIWAGIDDDDPSDYGRALSANLTNHLEVTIELRRGPRRSLSAWTNDLTAEALNGPNPPKYLASLGDDHRPRTYGWDRRLIEAIERLPGPGFAYGRDLLQDQNLPTAWVASAEAVRALGWMMLPACAHMCVDSAILGLGEAAGRIAYRPDVIVEHLHPLAGKANWDASYRESNADERYAADRAAFKAWRDEQFAADAATLAALTHEGCCADDDSKGDRLAADAGQAQGGHEDRGGRDPRRRP
jgi:hypothetical protein